MIQGGRSLLRETRLERLAPPPFVSPGSSLRKTLVVVPQTPRPMIREGLPYRGPAMFGGDWGSLAPE